MARYTGPKSRSPVNSVKESLELTKFCQRRTILPDNMVIQEKEKTSEYGVQLREKQKAKYTYWSFRKTIPQFV